MRARAWLALALACVAAGCDDVGDSSAIPSRDLGSYGSQDAAPSDATLPPPVDGATEAAAPGDDSSTTGQPNDAETIDTSVPGDDAGDLADTNPPDASLPDTSAPDTSLPDTGGGDAIVSGPQPCTATGQTGCVPCPGNADGVCTETEAAFVAHDIAAGHAASTDCYSCLFSSGCLDDTQFGDKGKECGDLTGNFGSTGQPSTGLCLATLRCVLASSCSSSDISICYCGPTNAGNACQTAAHPNGDCYSQEVGGLGVSDNATVLKDYTDTTRPSGMANQIFSCAESNGCSACLQ